VSTCCHLLCFIAYHHIDIVEVAGSSPVPPTILSQGFQGRGILEKKGFRHTLVTVVPNNRQILAIEVYHCSPTVRVVRLGKKNISQLPQRMGIL